MKMMEPAIVPWNAGGDSTGMAHATPVYGVRTRLACEKAN
jgi:hypothetical protein